MRSFVTATLCIIALWTTMQAANAEERTKRLSLDEAVSLALRENPTVRAKEFERRSVAANEITAGLRPNPTATFSGEQFTPGGSSGAAVTQYTLNIRLDAQRTYRETALEYFRALGNHQNALHQLAAVGGPLEN